jgi:hypothetical protein
LVEDHFIINSQTQGLRNERICKIVYVRILIKTFKVHFDPFTICNTGPRNFSIFPRSFFSHAEIYTSIYERGEHKRDYNRSRFSVTACQLSTNPAMSSKYPSQSPQNLPVIQWKRIKIAMKYHSIYNHSFHSALM